MIKRKEALKALKERDKALKAQKEQEEAEIACLKEKVAGLRKAVLDLLKTTPDDLWSLEELSVMLKPAKIVCETRKKFDEEQERENQSAPCQSCQKQQECGQPAPERSTGHPEKCQCEDEPRLCNLCLGFLWVVLKFMAKIKEADIFHFIDNVFIGIYRK